jgi:DNA topoisomerase-6 subunit B
MARKQTTRKKKSGSARSAKRAGKTTARKKVAAGAGKKSGKKASRKAGGSKSGKRTAGKSGKKKTGTKTGRRAAPKAGAKRTGKATGRKKAAGVKRAAGRGSRQEGRHDVTTTSTQVKSGRRRKRTKAADQEELLFDARAESAPGTPDAIPADEGPAPEPAARAGNGGAPARRGRRSAPATAASMAKKQREISVSEFFSKNRHLLGFDNPAKALLTTIKEAVDNSLDACEEAGILPDIRVDVDQLAEDRFRVAVQDNGPGIVKNQVPRIFGQLLYGSKFHRLRQSRGQQGIGISAAGMYGQITTGKPVVIVSRIARNKPAHHFEIQIDTRKNAPVVAVDREVDWNGVDHGTRVEIELEATYRKGTRSVDAYIQQTGLANPHLRLEYRPPKDEPVLYERAADELPKEPMEIKPHPHGIELGMLMKMLAETKSRNVRGFLTSEFSRVSPRVASEILAKAGIRENASPRTVRRNDVEALFKAVNQTKIMAPPTNCLSPIGEDLLVAGLKQEVEAAFYAASTRSPAVYRGNPFQVEVALAYGGKLPADEPITLYRYANRVPLLYQQGACAVTKAVIGTSWRSYGVQQSKGSLPIGPIVLMVHIASAWVPFTSESKEAIAHYPEILKEIKLGIQECGRRLGTFIRRGQREREAERKRSYIEKYIPHIGIALKEILGLSDKEEDRVVATLKDTLERARKMG